MFRYAEVQKALASLHGAYPEHLGAFRGRLQHFQRLGMAPASPGRGKVILYAFDDIARWAFGLELVELGIDPTRIVSMMDWLWPIVSPALCRKTKSDKVFIATPALLITQMIEREIKEGVPAQLAPINVFDTKPPRYVFDIDELASWRPGRAIMIDLSELQSRLRKALDDVLTDRSYNEERSDEP